MKRSWLALLLASAAAITLSSVVHAAKPARRAAARAAPMKLAEPLPPPGTVNAIGQMTPAEVMLRSPTAAESQANAVWSVRTALNVAAYQCGYSPFLGIVPLYNAILAQHSEELDRARRTLVGHFRRNGGARGDADFDQYQTRISNSYSTLDAQYAFCGQAAVVGRTVLGVAKGALGITAPEQSAAIRAALIPSSPLTFLGEVTVDPAIPDLQ